MPSWRCLERTGVRLAYRDFGGTGPPVVLLHGLAGHAGEWEETARWLRARNRVVAPDVRGHGRSERRPADVSRAAHVADVAFLVDTIALEPVVLVGQSLGGHTALLVAAEHPGLVRGLVLAEAGPSDGGDTGADEIRASLLRWPVPFPSRNAALDFFGGRSSTAAAWADGLEHRDGGWWPRFDVEVMAQTLQDALREPSWREWERITTPTLVVRAGHGIIGESAARLMVDRHACARSVVVEESGHDVHLDRPAEWRHALAGFLDALEEGGSHGR